MTRVSVAGASFAMDKSVIRDVRDEFLGCHGDEPDTERYLRLRVCLTNG